MFDLLDVLTQIEKEFAYQFTYADDIIEDVYVGNLPENLSFDQILNFLRQETKLTFTILNDTFVSINKGNKPFIICGVIKELIGDKLLSGATIRGVKSSTTSDRNGYFELEVFSDKESITIDHLGFKTIYIDSRSFNTLDCEHIYMTSETEILAEVILKDYLTKGISKTDDGVFQIEYDDFGILPGLIEADVLQTIQALPGVQSTDETVSNINIRGGTHDQNLILWDGIKMYQSGHFFGLISIFNPNITGNATLIKNGTGTEYTDSVSGTILMNTDTEINSSFKSSAGLNLISADAFTDIPIGKNSSVQLSARKSISNLIKTPTYEQYFDRISQDSEIGSNNETDIEFDFYDINLRWNWKISKKDKLRINFLGINNELVFTENSIIDTNISSRQSSLTQRSIAGGIWYQRYWSERFISSLQVYETDYTLKSINVNLQDQQRFLQENVVSETGIKLNTHYTLNKNFIWLNGYQLTETGISNLNDIDNPTFRRNKIRVIRNHGFFSQLGYKGFKKKNSINFGLRYSFNEKFNKHIIEPRLSYNQKFLNYFNFEILGEFKHQNTSQIINFQNDFLGIEKRRWVLANDDDIPVIKSKQVSFGLQFNRKGWLVSSEGYYKLVNGITARSQGFRNQYEFEEAIGDYVISGVDFLINKRFRNVSSWLSYSYVNNEYTFEAFDEKKFPNNVDITHSFTLGVAYTIKDLKISAGLNWHSGLPTTRPEFLNEIEDDRINYDPANSARLPEYLRLDISATYDFFLTKKVKCHAGISVWNFSDKNNSISNYYRINEENEPNEVVNSSLAITPNATFRVSF
ncbi:TonB-dependent receptor [Aquimarina sp. 2201CG14-23]|uniref:TonB-dependent receptor n=1 Tax=Aquimarina mycalae TaxID=3040073 RepID=UPI002478092E|nr:TonB-dependent receptor plug domain-containing protein [Aquimarina sp. 2201CG14-23]MDH7444397.1 TonB-dependent receptor plug domain-containing protein [Aquimarina sp. 2201CG14-23]